MNTEFTIQLRNFIENAIRRRDNPDRSDLIKRQRQKRSQKREKVASRYGM